MKKSKRKQIIRMEGDPILEMVAEECSPDVFEREGIGNRLFSIMKRLPNAQGLAAPQLGLSKRAVIVRWKGECTVMYNPKIKCRGIYWRRSVETCLSCYHIYVVHRPGWLVVQYEDKDGMQYTEFCWYRKARIVMHEVDHLNGKCINRGKEKGCYANAGNVSGLT